MLTPPANVKLYLADRPVDFRKSFDGLAAIVEHQFGMQPTCGHVFVFLNRRATQVRMLFWERDGFCLVSKRLEAGTFRRVKRAGSGELQVELDSAELMLLLEGIEVSAMRRRKRYSSGEKSAPSAEDGRQVPAA